MRRTNKLVPAVTGRKLLNIDANNPEAITLLSAYREAPGLLRQSCPPLGQQGQSGRRARRDMKDRNK